MRRALATLLTGLMFLSVPSVASAALKLTTISVKGMVCNS